MTSLTWTVGLLIVSNIFMTFAWYGHLKWFKGSALWIAIAASWGLAFAEYCFQVPANRIGYQNNISLVELKTIQEVITLTVFGVFMVCFFNDSFKWNHFVGFALLVAAAFFIFKKW